VDVGSVVRRAEPPLMGPEARFVFVVGASGSGTTLLTEVLSAPPGAASLGGNHVRLPDESPEAVRLVTAFNHANQALWDRHAELGERRAARVRLAASYRELLDLPAYRALTHVLYKRSAPFMLGDRYRPDLGDIVELFPGARTVVAYRDPRASTVSALRRGFAQGLGRCASITEDSLTYLSAQLATLPEESYRVVGYEAFCADPTAHARTLAPFLGLDAEALVAAVRGRAIDPRRGQRWPRELDDEASAALDRFFDARRLAQWPLLARR